MHFLNFFRATFQSLVAEPIKLFLEFVEQPNSTKSPLEKWSPLRGFEPTTSQS